MGGLIAKERSHPDNLWMKRKENVSKVVRKYSILDGDEN
jgi:hypothetical protein